MFSITTLALGLAAGAAMFFALITVLASIRVIGPTEVGLVTKRFSSRKLSEDNPIAFDGEAGYQADMLMPGLRWKLCLLYRVEKFPWVRFSRAHQEQMEESRRRR